MVRDKSVNYNLLSIQIFLENIMIFVPIIAFENFLSFMFLNGSWFKYFFVIYLKS